MRWGLCIYTAITSAQGVIVTSPSLSLYYRAVLEKKGEGGGWKGRRNRYREIMRHPSSSIFLALIDLLHHSISSLLYASIIIISGLWRKHSKITSFPQFFDSFVALIGVAIVTYPLHLISFTKRTNSWKGWGSVSEIFPLSQRGIAYWRCFWLSVLDLQLIYGLSFQMSFFLERKFKFSKKNLLKVLEYREEDEEEENKLTLKELCIVWTAELGKLLALAIVHMPVRSVLLKLLHSPDQYSGIKDCVQKTYQAEGVGGFYKGMFWYILSNCSFF